MTDQKVHLLGMLTEAIHTPLMSDRALSLENASYVYRTMADLGNEIEFKPDGIMAKRADQVLHEAASMLETIKTDGLFKTLEMCRFANVKRPQNGGKGLDGVAGKQEGYFNPFIELMQQGGKA